MLRQGLYQAAALSAAICLLFAYTAFAEEDTVIVMREKGDELEMEDAGSFEGEGLLPVTFIGEFEEDYPGMDVYVELESDITGPVSLMIQRADGFSKTVSLPAAEYTVLTVMAEGDVANHYPLRAEKTGFSITDGPESVKIFYENRHDTEIDEKDKNYVASVREEGLPTGKAMLIARSENIPDQNVEIQFESENGRDYTAILSKESAYTALAELPAGTYSFRSISGKDGAILTGTYMIRNSTFTVKDGALETIEVYYDNPSENITNVTIPDLQEETSAPGSDAESVDHSDRKIMKTIVIATALLLIAGGAAVIERKRKR